MSHPTPTHTTVLNELGEMLERVRDRCKELGVEMYAMLESPEAGIVVKTEDASDARETPVLVVVEHEGGVLNSLVSSAPVQVLFLDADTEGLDESKLATVDDELRYPILFSALTADDTGSAQVCPEEATRIFDALCESTEAAEPGPREKPFAVIYGDGGNQLLVQLMGKDGPEVRIYFRLKGLGICCIQREFYETDAGWRAAEELFAEFAADEGAARAEAKRAQSAFAETLSAHEHGLTDLATDDNAPFAKLFGTDGRQMLVLMAPDEDAMKVRIYAWPHEKLQRAGSTTFELSEEGVSAAAALFEGLDEDALRSIFTRGMAEEAA